MENPGSNALEEQAKNYPGVNFIQIFHTARGLLCPRGNGKISQKVTKRPNLLRFNLGALCLYKGETMSSVAVDIRLRHRFTVAEYHRMAESGMLAPDARVELIEGEIIDMPPIGSPHAGTVSFLGKRFEQGDSLSTARQRRQNFKTCRH